MARARARARARDRARARVRVRDRDRDRDRVRVRARDMIRASMTFWSRRDWTTMSRSSGTKKKECTLRPSACHGTGVVTTEQGS